MNGVQVGGYAFTPNMVFPFCLGVSGGHMLATSEHSIFGCRLVGSDGCR